MLRANLDGVKLRLDEVEVVVLAAFSCFHLEEEVRGNDLLLVAIDN